MERITGGHDQPIDDYLNDMDGRQLLEQARDLVPPEIGEMFAGRIREADARLRRHLVPAGRCLWGEIVAADEGWRPDRNWWYFERPRAPGPLLQRGLDGP